MTGVEAVRLSAGEAEAEIAIRGAEPVSWRVGGRQLLWHGDPEHWSYRAPILFPVVGASRGGAITVDGVAHPMPQHGFARTLPFDLVERSGTTARLRLADTPESRAAYPFRFALDVTATLAPDSLSLAFTVENRDGRPMPYGLGVHPAFPWPLVGDGKAGHRVRFEDDERAAVPEIAPGGLLARRTRAVPLDDRVLPLSPEIFTEALVFLDARSRQFAFEAPDGSAIGMELDNFPHLAVWSRPTAPFLSLEAWTGHADWEDATGDLETRASMIRLLPGATGGHRVTMRWSPGDPA